MSIDATVLIIPRRYRGCPRFSPRTSSVSTVHERSVSPSWSQVVAFCRRRYVSLQHVKPRLCVRNITALTRHTSGLTAKVARGDQYGDIRGHLLHALFFRHLSLLSRTWSFNLHLPRDQHPSNGLRRPIQAFPQASAEQLPGRPLLRAFLKYNSSVWCSLLSMTNECRLERFKTSTLRSLTGPCGLPEIMQCVFLP